MSPEIPPPIEELLGTINALLETKGGGNLTGLLPAYYTGPHSEYDKPLFSEFMFLVKCGAKSTRRMKL